MQMEHINIGMIGGGTISESHRMGILFDNRYRFVAGVFSRNKKKSLDIAKKWGIDAQRVYADYQEMAQKESERADGITAVSIVTHDKMHYPIAKCFLNYGMHIICDKPLTNSLEEAMELHALVQKHNLIFTLTHNYTAYPMVREAGRLVRNGVLGDIIIAHTEHATGSLNQSSSSINNPTPPWRYDLNETGKESIIYDVGTHAHILMRFITGLEVESLTAEINNLTQRTAVYDNAVVLMRLSNGAQGTLWCSKVATGHEHGLRIRVYGTQGSLEWDHDDPHHLIIREKDGSSRKIAQGHASLSKDSINVTRLSQGHPEGFFESFANIYKDTADKILHVQNEHTASKDLEVPNSYDGVLGVQFVELCVESFHQGGAWTSVEKL